MSLFAPYLVYFGAPLKGQMPVQVLNQSPPPSSPFISRVNPGEPAGLSIDTTCDNWQSIGAVAAEIIARARLPLPSLDPSKSTFSVSLEYRHRRG